MKRQASWFRRTLAGLGIAAFVGLATLAPGLAQGGCPPDYTTACMVSGNDTVGCDELDCVCTEECSDPTPAVPAPVVTPQPTSTPPNQYNATFCAPLCERPGETRPVMFDWLCQSYFQCVPVGVIPSGNCCDPPCSCAEPTDEKPPLVPGPETWCSEYGASVSCSLPVWYADRLPYPRALVTLETVFWVSDANGNPTIQLPVSECWSTPVDPDGERCACRADGNCDENPPQVGTICDYKLGLKAEPSANTPPTWSCEEGGGGLGYQVSCMWQHSSAGKPARGRGVECESLPAFSVSASVPYWWSIGRQWEQWEQIGACDADTCGCRLCEDSNGCPDMCDCRGDGKQCGKNEFCGCDPEYGWVHHGPDWKLIDLTVYNYTTPYMLNFKVQQAPYRGCGQPPVGALYVPCIEVQGVISNPEEP